MDDELWVTVWKDGTWKVWSQGDAWYAQNDDNWLLSVPRKDFLNPSPDSPNVRPDMPQREGERSVDVTRCARCNGDHPDLHFQKLQEPVDFDGLAEHWAICPTTGEPIMLETYYTDGGTTV